MNSGGRGNGRPLPSERRTTLRRYCVALVAVRAINKLSERTEDWIARESKDMNRSIHAQNRFARADCHKTLNVLPSLGTMHTHRSSRLDCQHDNHHGCI